MTASIDRGLELAVQIQAMRAEPPSANAGA